MRRNLFVPIIAIMLAVSTFSAMALAEITAAPENATEAFETAKQMLEVGMAKQWLAFSALGIWLAVFLFKTARDKWFPTMEKRWLYIIVGVLSILAMLLAKFQGDLSWGAAITVLSSGPAVAFINDLIKRGILNKEPESK